MDHFTNQFQGPEMYEQKKFGIQALVILSLKIPFEPIDNLFLHNQEPSLRYVPN